MRSVFSAVFLSFLVTVGATPHGPENTDEDRIKALIQDYVKARNDRDADSLRSLFTADADQLVSTGEWRKGIDALVSGAIATSKKESGQSSIVLDSIRFLDHDVALAEGRYETASAATGQTRKMWTTLALKRTQAGWRITAIRNMLPAAPAEKR